MIRADHRVRSDFALLGVPAGADEAALRRAFLAAVKTHRPDHGGDPERYREIIAAYGRLRPRPEETQDLDYRLDVKISAELAKGGGHRIVDLPDGRRVRVRIPKETRMGDMLRLQRQGRSAPGRWGDVYLTIAVAEPAKVRVVPPSPPELQPSTRSKLRRFQDSWAA